MVSLDPNWYHIYSLNAYICEDMYILSRRLHWYSLTSDSVFSSTSYNTNRNLCLPLATSITATPLRQHSVLLTVFSNDDINHACTGASSAEPHRPPPQDLLADGMELMAVLSRFRLQFAWCLGRHIKVKTTPPYVCGATINKCDVTVHTDVAD